MPYEPKTKLEINADMVARLVGTSELTDVTEGGQAAGLLGTVADELEGIEYRLFRIREGFTFEDAIGTDLDDRAADLPGFVPRMGPFAARGTGIQLTLADHVVPVVVQAGTSYSRSDDPGVLYIQQADVTVPAGQNSYPEPGDPEISVVAAVTGTRGNAPAGVIDRIVDGPEEVLSARSVGYIGGGAAQELDDALKGRMRLYLAGLAGSQPQALEYVAKSYSAGGVNVRHARIFEDPTRAAYSELVVDDGTGTLEAVAKATATFGTVPVGSTFFVQTVIYHHGPATEPISEANFKINGAPAPLDSAGRPRWTSVQERGLIYPDATLLSPGDTWEVSGHLVFVGAIAAIQRLIEGDPSAPLAAPGKRAAGTRVVVRGPLRQPLLGLKLNVVLFDGYDPATVRTSVVGILAQYSAELAPGDPFLLAEATRRVMQEPGVRNVTFIGPSNGLYPPHDYYPVSPRHKLILTTNNVEVI